MIPKFEMHWLGEPWTWEQFQLWAHMTKRKPKGGKKSKGC